MINAKERINVSLPKSARIALKALAKRDAMPEATKAAYLLQLALEIEEDQIWDRIAEKRDTKKAKFLTHKEAWA